MSDPVRTTPDVPQFRYNAALANEIEAKWQDHWDARPHLLGPEPDRRLSPTGSPPWRERRKLYVLDMFPYPSGAGLHVGHPLGYIGTDVYARFMRMQRPQRAARDGLRRVRAARRAVRGADRPAPARHHRGEHRQHAAPVARARPRPRPPPGRRHHRRRLLPLDPVDLPPAATAPGTTTTQDRARPIDELLAELEDGARAPESDANPDGLAWHDLDGAQRRAVVDSYRLAYLDDALGELVPGARHGAGQRRGHRRRPQRARQPPGVPASAHAVDAAHHRVRRPSARRPRPARLARVDQADAAQLDRPQRRCRGRVPGRGARRRRDRRVHHPSRHAVRRHLHGAGARASAGRRDRAGPVAAPIRRSSGGARSGSTSSPTEAVASYREFAAQKSELERQAEGREKTGVFTGAFAKNPTNGWNVPVFIADYVLMGYGTGAIMAVPAHDQRDFEFADEFDLPVVGVVRPPDAWFDARARTRRAGVGVARGLHRRRRRHGVEQRRGLARRPGHGRGQGRTSSAGSRRSVPARRPSPTSCATGCSAGSATGASRSRSSTTPTAWPHALPGVDAAGRAARHHRLRAAHPRRRRRGSARAAARARRRLGARASSISATGRSVYRRETNTMPQWAGSCWYYLRYLDPTNADALVDPEIEQYWMGEGGSGGVDLYVGGAEHAVLHLLYARFWHKVLFDLGHVSTPEPFHRLSTRAPSPPPRSPTSAARTSTRRRSRSATVRGSTTAPRSSATTARWARA